MTDQIVRLGPEYFPRPTSGIPVAGGSIYIGDPDTDPEIPGNQITVNALQENGSTVPISQPILTGGGGVPLYNGSPVTLLVSESYSLKVLDAFDVQVYYVPSAGVDPVEEFDAVVSVENIADLRLFTEISLAVEMMGYTISGDGGGGLFIWDASDLFTEVTADTLSGIYVAPTTDLTGASGAWVRQYKGGVYTEWFSLTDAGLAINAIIAMFSSAGVSIQLNAKTYDVLTKIDIDIKDPMAAISIEGKPPVMWQNGFTSAVGGTILDGTALLDDVLIGAITKSNFNIRLTGFSVLPHASHNGLMLGVGFSCAHLFAENLSVSGGINGIYIGDAYASWINKLYCSECTGYGMYFYRCNASKFGIITARRIEGEWGIIIENGSGTDYGALYIESCNKSALRLASNIRGSVIQSLYLENNNIDNTQDYEVYIGDTSISALDIDNLTINGCFANDLSNDPAIARFAIGNVSNLNFNSLRANGVKFLKVLGDTIQNLHFSSCSIPALSTLDFASTVAGSSITFTSSLVVDPSDITYPSNTSVRMEFVGCGAALEGEKYVNLTASAALKSHQTTVRTTGTTTVTLPNADNAAGKLFSITNRDAALTVTVAGEGGNTIMGSVNSTIPPLEGATYRSDGVSDWLIVGRGAK